MSQQLKRRKVHVAAPSLLLITAFSLVVAKMFQFRGYGLEAMHRAGSGYSVTSNGLNWGDSRVSSQSLPCAASSGWQ